MEPYLGFIFATSVGVGLASASLLISRKAGLAPIQAQLIDTLQDNAAALTSRVSQLEADLDRERKRGDSLAATVKDLRDTVTDLAHENATLRKRLGMGER